jgi:dienelactone hydrolase
MEWVWRFANGRAGRVPIASVPDAAASYAGHALAADPRRFFGEPPPASIAIHDVRAVPGGRVERWQWRSGYPTWDHAYQDQYDAFDHNRDAHVECWWRDGAESATAICLHSWMGGAIGVQRRFFAQLFERGCNVCLFTLPFHGARTPSQARFGGQLFPGRNLRRTNEGFGQLVWDVRTLLRQLALHGLTRVGVVGMSLGGYAAALLAGLEPGLAFAVPIVPMVDLAELMFSHGKRRPARVLRETGGRSLAEMRVAYAVHSPLRYRPLVPYDRRLIIAGRGDRICHPQHVETLWRHWDRPAISWWSGGHVAQLGRQAAFGVLGEFLAA